MTEIRVASFRKRIVVDVDDLVEIPGDNFGDLLELVEVIDSCLVVDKSIQCDRGKIADGNLVFG